MQGRVLLTQPAMFLSALARPPAQLKGFSVTNLQKKKLQTFQIVIVVLSGLQSRPKNQC